MLRSVARTSATNGFGSDIYVVALNGTGLRPLLEHEGDNVFYASPALDAAGQSLYVHRRQPLVESGAWAGLTDEIVRVDLRTGERTPLARDEADLALSPDGTYVAYMHLKTARPSPCGASEKLSGAGREDLRAAAPRAHVACCDEPGSASVT